MAVRPCEIDGCDSITGVPGTAKGLCSAHYQRARRYGGDPLGERDCRNRGQVCSADDCDTPAHSLGYCRTHYSRIRRNGTLADVRPFANAPEGEKWCPVCSSYKPLDGFAVNSSRPNGLQTECKPCGSERTAAWRLANPDKVAALSARRDQAESAKASSEWRRRNPEKVADASRRRRALRRGAETESFLRADVLAASGTTCRLCDEAIDLEVKWPHPQSYSIDHVIPLSRGGSHTLANVQSTHLRCNLRKHASVTTEVG